VDPQTPKQSKTDDLDSLIFSNRKLEAIEFLRRQQGLSIAKATEALASRYKQLRAAFPDRFSCDDAEYWRGFHS
jgi:hypothetical protein